MLHEAIWDIMDDQRSQSKTIKHLKWTWKTQLHDGYMYPFDGWHVVPEEVFMRITDDFASCIHILSFQGKIRSKSPCLRASLNKVRPTCNFANFAFQRVWLHFHFTLSSKVLQIRMF
jgi:hypothetical protein